MAIPLAGAFRLSPRHGWISLHGFDAVAPDCVVVVEITGSDSKIFLDCASARRRSAWFRSFRARVAGPPRSGSGFGARITASESALAMACFARGMARFDLAVVDR